MAKICETIYAEVAPDEPKVLQQYHAFSLCYITSLDGSNFHSILPYISLLAFTTSSDNDP